MEKYDSELAYWVNRYVEENYNFENSHYSALMKNILGGVDDKFFTGKTILDFGCGPRGSLQWASNAARRIGVDVLVPKYLTIFGENMKNHNMEYVASTESSIPLPDNVADIVFSINSFDHVENIDVMAKELLRVLKPGGIFAASFNLFEPANNCEPQTLTPKILNHLFFKHLTKVKSKIAHKGEPTYANFDRGRYIKVLDPEIPSIMWVSVSLVKYHDE